MGASFCVWVFLFMWFYCIRNLLLMSKKIFHPVCSSFFRLFQRARCLLVKVKKVLSTTFCLLQLHQHR